MKSVVKTALFLSLAFVVFAGMIVASFSGLFPQYFPKKIGVICLCVAACAVGAWLIHLRRHENEILRGKIRREQLEFLNECFGRKLSRVQIVALVMKQKDALSEQIKQSVGRCGRKKAAELDMMIESGWKDIIAVFSTGSQNLFAEYAETECPKEDSSVILPEKAEDVLPYNEHTENGGNEQEELEELEEVFEGELVDEQEELETDGELELLEAADSLEDEKTIPQDGGESVEKTAKDSMPELLEADDDDDELLELEAADEDEGDDLYAFASSPFFEPGRKYSLLKSVLLNDNVDENIQIMKSINESYADRKNEVLDSKELDSERLEFSDPDVVQDETPDMSIADNFTVFTPYVPYQAAAAARVRSESQPGTENNTESEKTGKETTDEMDTDAEDMEILPERDRKPFMLTSFGAGDGQVIDLMSEAVVEGADGVYYIADNLDTGAMPVDRDFKNLVDSVLR